MAPDLGPLLSWAEPVIDFLWLVTNPWFWIIIVVIAASVAVWLIWRYFDKMR